MGGIPNCRIITKHGVLPAPTPRSINTRRTRDMVQGATSRAMGQVSCRALLSYVGLALSTILAFMPSCDGYVIKWTKTDVEMNVMQLGRFCYNKARGTDEKYQGRFKGSIYWNAIHKPPGEEGSKAGVGVYLFNHLAGRWDDFSSHKQVCGYQECDKTSCRSRYPPKWAPYELRATYNIPEKAWFEFDWTLESWGPRWWYLVIADCRNRTGEYAKHPGNMKLTVDMAFTQKSSRVAPLDTIQTSCDYDGILLAEVIVFCVMCLVIFLLCYAIFRQIRKLNEVHYGVVLLGLSTLCTTIALLVQIIARSEGRELGERLSTHVQSTTD